MYISMVTLTWSPYGIFLHFLLIWSKRIPKSQTCPSQMLGKNFHGPLNMRYAKNEKNPNVFVKNDQNPLLLVLVGKEIVCRLRKHCWILFSPMKIKRYGRKTWLWHNFCESLDYQKDLIPWSHGFESFNKPNLKPLQCFVIKICNTVVSFKFWSHQNI